MNSTDSPQKNFSIQFELLYFNHSIYILYTTQYTRTTFSRFFFSQYLCAFQFSSFYCYFRFYSNVSVNVYDCNEISFDDCVKFTQVHWKVLNIHFDKLNVWFLSVILITDTQTHLINTNDSIGKHLTTNWRQLGYSIQYHFQLLNYKLAELYSSVYVRIYTRMKQMERKLRANQRTTQ